VVGDRGGVVHHYHADRFLVVVDVEAFAVDVVTLASCPAVMVDVGDEDGAGVAAMVHRCEACLKLKNNIFIELKNRKSTQKAPSPFKESIYNLLISFKQR
jgi:hypothetical protein